MRLSGLVLLLASALGLCLLVACGGEEPRFRPVPREASDEIVPEAHPEPAVRVEPAAVAEPPAPAPGDLPAPEDVAAPPAGAERTATGLASRILRPGTGTVHPTATSRVRVHYTGWQTNGHMFDSSRRGGTPAEFPLNGVIAGWTEGLQLMVEGEERRFWIPADLAYGDPPRRPGAPGGMLVFDVELLAIL